MSTHDYEIANQTMPSARADINSALSAIKSSNSANLSPSNPTDGMIWLKTLSSTSFEVYIYLAGDFRLIGSYSAGTYTQVAGKIKAAGTALEIVDSNNNRIVRFEAGKAVVTEFEGEADSVKLSGVPKLPASRITSGTFETARIPGLPASKITSGIIDAARLPTSTTGQPTITKHTITTPNVETTIDYGSSITKTGRLTTRSTGSR